MSYRYNIIEREAKRLYRRFFPVPKSPWTAGYVEDICAVNLVPPEKLLNFFDRCITILENVKGDEMGDYLEFGVFNGSSIGSMYLAAKKRALASMRFFGFDAFEGLPPGSENEDGGVWKKGFYSCSFEKMQECLVRRGIQSGDITWIKGWYDQTLKPGNMQAYGITNLGIVFIDCDTYSSSKAVLDYIAPLIKKPCIICLDDWKLNDLDIKGMGEYKSFNEFLEANRHLKAEEIKSYNRKSRSFLICPLID